MVPPRLPQNTIVFLAQGVCTSEEDVCVCVHACMCDGEWCVCVCVVGDSAGAGGDSVCSKWLVACGSKS